MDTVTAAGSMIGLAFAVLGAGLALGLGGAGSSIGIGYAGMTASGVITEDPKKFGRLIPFISLPGTQGIYGLAVFFIIAQKLGVITGEVNLPTLGQGLQLCFLGFSAGIVFLASGAYQGKVAAAAIGIIAKKPDQAGKALILPAFVETYAVLALVAALLVIFNMKLGV
jgi:V/A-type H+/Na+-transporting ATPase subunit K